MYAGLNSIVCVAKATSGPSCPQIPAADGATSLVYRLVAGTDVEATFDMSAGTFTLRSTYPGQVFEDGGRGIGTFYFDEPSTIQECIRRIPEGHDVETQTYLLADCRFKDEDRRKELVKCHRECMSQGGGPLVRCVKGCSSVELLPSSKPPVGQVALPAEPVIDGIPRLEEWASAKEIGVRGSDAHGCETRQLKDFIRVVCRPNEATGKVMSASWESGTDRATSYSVAGGGAAVLLTRYAQGTAAKAAIRWERTAATLVLEWPQTSKAPPPVRGSITKT